jgi:hypothetical protein
LRRVKTADVPDADAGKFAALDHRVDRGAADAEPLRDITSGQELLGENDLRDGLEGARQVVYGKP